MVAIPGFESRGGSSTASAASSHEMNENEPPLLSGARVWFVVLADFYFLRLVSSLHKTTMLSLL